jgi:F-type H+-transporting ATPase subunit alpha
MPVEDQVVQIYGATNGYLDRIVVDKVPRFLADLTDFVRGNEPELLKKIARGDWSEETQAGVEVAVTRFAKDFGFDLDEEGHPIDEGGDDLGSTVQPDAAPEEAVEEKEEEAVPA